MPSFQKTVTTSPTLLVAANRADQMIYLHSGSGTIYIGDADVTISNGYRMDNGDKLAMQLSDLTPLYAVAATGTPIVYIYETIN